MPGRQFPAVETMLREAEHNLLAFTGLRSRTGDDVVDQPAGAARLVPKPPVVVPAFVPPLIDAVYACASPHPATRRADRGRRFRSKWHRTPK
jgi:hypothetical protein